MIQSSCGYFHFHFETFSSRYKMQINHDKKCCLLDYFKRFHIIWFVDTKFEEMMGIKLLMIVGKKFSASIDNLIIDIDFSKMTVKFLTICNFIFLKQLLQKLSNYVGCNLISRTLILWKRKHKICILSKYDYWVTDPDYKLIP